MLFSFHHSWLSILLFSSVVPLLVFCLCFYIIQLSIFFVFVIYGMLSLSCLACQYLLWGCQMHCHGRDRCPCRRHRLDTCPHHRPMGHVSSCHSDQMSQRSDVSPPAMLTPVIPLLWRPNLVRLFLVGGPLSVGVSLFVFCALAL
jgi:hypothetical protein